MVGSPDPTTGRYRIGPDAAVYFVTFSVVDWLPVFVNEATCRITTESLTYCHHQKSLRINAFVIMPTHMHAILFDAESNSDRLRQTIGDFRKFTGRRLSDYCAGHLSDCFRRVLKESAGEDRERRFWQRTRHPVAIGLEPFWRQKLVYLHDNPCRKGLVRRAIDWRFSSAGYWLTDGRELSDVPLTAIV